MSKRVKKLAWITSNAFLDTDINIVPDFVRNYQKEYYVCWYILKKADEKLDFENTIYGLKNDHCDVKVVVLTDKSYTIARIKQWIHLFYVIKGVDVVYLEMFGMPFFCPIAAWVLNSDKTIMAIHNVKVPVGGKNYHLAVIYRNLTLQLFKKFQVFSNSQYEEIQKLTRGKKAYKIPFALKDYGTANKSRKNHSITFMNFGNIRRYKRIDMLIDASQEAYEQTGIKFRVIIAGKCDNWDDYALHIRYPEIFDIRIGRVEEKEIPNLFEETDYFVAPYQDIAQSGSAIVAINYSKPIIASRLEAFEEYITDNENGYLFDAGDLNKLTEKMVYVLRHHNEIYSKVCDGQNNIKKKNFDKDAILKQYYQMFEEIKYE